MNIKYLKAKRGGYYAIAFDESGDAIARLRVRPSDGTGKVGSNRMWIARMGFMGQGPVFIDSTRKGAVGLALRDYLKKKS